MACTDAPLVIPALLTPLDLKTPHDVTSSSCTSLSSPRDLETLLSPASTSTILADHPQPSAPYRLSWRTLVAFFVLNIAFSATIFAALGPNSSISSIVHSFPPDQQRGGSWIASAPNFCYVSLPVVLGSLADRYGSKWFIVTGALLSVVGSVLSGSAPVTSLNTVVIGQVVTFIGSSAVVLTVPAIVEAVPAKSQGSVFGMTMLINTLLGSVGGTFVYAACIQHALNVHQHLDGWKWGFYIQAVIFAVSAIAVALGYHPPPPRLGRNRTFKECLRTLDFLGLLLLISGTILITLALTWGGVTFPWSDRRILTPLLGGPILLIIFSMYEWKGRSDGLMHHAFFWSRNFPILLVLGFVDGMLLYSTSFFIPAQIHALYASAPLDVALRFLPFQVALAAGSLAFGVHMSTYKSFRTPLIIANVAATIFCSLLIFSTPETSVTFDMLIALLGFVAASTTVFPVAGIAAVSPPYLTATAVTILATFRSVGGSLGIAIPTAIYDLQMYCRLSNSLNPLLKSNGIDPHFWSLLEQVALHSPSAISQLPFIASLHNGTVVSDQIQDVVLQANTESYRFVWVGFASVCGACSVLSLFLQEIPERFTNHVESKLEPHQFETSEKALIS